MPSKIQMRDVNHQKTLVMRYNTEVRRSLPCQTPKLTKEKVISPRASRGLKLQDKDKALNCNLQTMIPAQGTGGRPSLPAKSRGCYQKQKPWSNGEGTGSEALVKHLSNVPGYLQRIEGGDKLQGKVLNYGVLDSRRLEKWTESLNRHRDSSAGEDHAQILEGEASRHTAGFRESEIASRNSPVGHHYPADTDRCLRVDDLDLELEKSERKGSPTKAVTHNVCHSPKTRTLPSTAKDRGISDSVNGKMKALDVKSDSGKAKFQESSHECPCTSLFTGDCPQHRPSGLSHHVDGGMLNHLQERIHGSHRFNFGSTELCNIIKAESSRKSFTETFSSEDFQFANLSPDAKPPKRFAAKMPDRWSWDGAKTTTTTGRESLSIHQSSAGPNGMIRSSSVREGSTTQQLKRASCSDSPNGDKATDTSRARRSPLRRILDPLLKSKAFNRTHLANHAAGSPMRRCAGKPLIQEELASNNGACNPSNATTNSSICHSGEKITGIHGSAHDEKHKASTRQALLQLAWKNGFPLFTFSVNESDILAATRKNCTSGKEDSECNYTFYYVREIMKKSGGWINQVSKSRRQGLVSDVVARMNVSCLRCPKLTGNEYKNHFSVREFVLFGAGLRPISHEMLESIPNSELAAIVVRVPGENAESFNGDLQQSDNCRVSSVTELEKERCSCHPVGNLESEQNLEKNVPKMVAILPNEVHGLSDTGKPSPLVERWTSGGSCDCGGWDAGCSLKILTDGFHESRRSAGVVQSSCTTDGTHRVELFVQEGQENRLVFSLVAFKEGLYTVDFHASVAVLQAFAVCVAILHGEKPAGHSEVQNSRRQQRTSTQGRASPYHPPISPVGRA